MGWLAGLWRDVLAAPVDGPEADFYRARRWVAVRGAVGGRACASAIRR